MSEKRLLTGLQTKNITNIDRAKIKEHQSKQISEFKRTIKKQLK